jgi:cytochrome oxidase Cu insertion factor (SCO1/SenC/PrrC family)
MSASIPTQSEEIISKIKAAQTKFRRTKSTIDDRRDSLRELSDILEHLRPQIKTVLMSKDENELFQIANNFGIRHFNSKQKDEYDKPVWHAWIFYCYLATIHACLRLLEKQPLSGH